MAYPLWAWHFSAKCLSIECTAMSILQQVLKKTSRQRPLPDQKAFSLSDSSIFSVRICLFIKLAKRIPFHSCIGSAIRFSIKPTNKDFYQTWGPISPEILRCYIVKAPYIPEVIGTELKNNQAKRGYYDLSLVIIDWLTISDVCKHKFCLRHCHWLWNSKRDCYGTWLEKALQGGLAQSLINRVV